MKFSLEWLKQHLDTDASAQAIANKLTAIGLEVEGVSNAAERLAPFRVARILTAEGHPQADKLQVLTVDAGEGAAVVPGAPPEAPTATGLLVAAGRLDVWGVGTGDTPGAGATSGWMPPSPPRPATPPTAPADTTSGSAYSSGNA